MIRTSARPAVPAARFGVLGLAAILVLGGCSGSTGEPNAEAAENSSSSASATNSSGPIESATPSTAPAPAAAYKPATAEGPAENVPLPIMPELAKRESKEGLIAFGAYWFSLLNYGYETGDASPVKALSTPECQLCELYYVDLEEGYENDDWIQGGKISISSSGSQFQKTSEGRYQLLLSIRQGAGVNRGPNGVIYGEGSAGDKQATAQIMEATYVSNHWVVNLVENM
ncbi:DUF6318 family protein [Arthrobacter gengyunqii]|uniref:DUF6318 family protein n=1 Tax=Arthrobacter gengyunqii TaxID=2886940 RepID=A0A9X1M1Z5_9MICC|nr:DUF6318 family protein [Arthrobacter gengyunqii]MCC3269948.1 DUF6318 family protein [Arthrobacter gengyunqii]UOY95125.1 DUF6318 family protein [Arthrobacter gengyunqii]